MQTLHQRIHITYQYAVHFTQHLFALDNPLLYDVIQPSMQNEARLLCVIDSGVVQCHAYLPDAIVNYCQQHKLKLVCMPLIMLGGEEAKNDLAHVRIVHDAIHEHSICRHSYVLAIGGGALLDMVGYAAATAHRGVRLIRVPTTVLAQNDAGIGVKNGINAYHKKNFIGTFAPPIAVLNDAYFLTSLAERDWRSGTAEAVKVALLKDAAFFGDIEQQADCLVARDMQVMTWLIQQCARLHLEHIANSGDPFETGSSRPLDFGHWAAHKLEQLSHYRLRHGEAVAVGLALDATYAYRMGMLPQSDWQRILRLLVRLGFTLAVPELRTRSDKQEYALLTGLDDFREHLGGQLTLSQLERIGQSIEVHSVDKQTMIDSIEFVANCTQQCCTG
jgi:3-dehydroquinate synthase